MGTEEAIVRIITDPRWEAYTVLDKFRGAALPPHPRMEMGAWEAGAARAEGLGVPLLGPTWNHGHR